MSPIIAREAIIQAANTVSYTSMNRKIIRILIIALAAGLGLALSSQLFKPKTPAVAQSAMETVRLINAPRALPEFALETQQGSLGNKDLMGRWTVVFIGFTHCPDICPTTLSDMARAQALWESSGLRAKPKLLFVSIDPERDTPAKIAEYAAYFHKDTLTATATATGPQLAEFTRALGLVYMKVPQGDSYTMDHSATLAVINPRGEFAGIIRPPLNPEAIARDLLALSKVLP